jgi:hypothetical protein
MCDRFFYRLALWYVLRPMDADRTNLVANVSK